MREQHRVVRALLLITAVVVPGCEGGDSRGPDGSAAPPAEQNRPEHAPEVTAAALRGKDLFFGKAMCSTCHRVGDRGTMVVGPNLGIGEDMKAPVAVRASSRKPEAEPAAYVIESILDPDAVVADGYAPGVMKSPDDIPIALGNDDLVALAAFLITDGSDTPLGADALEVAREAIAPARASRDARRPQAAPRKP